MKKILLIGGAGYVGTVISSHFLKIGFSVVVMDNFIYNNQFSISPFIGDPNYSIFYGDITNNSNLDTVSQDITDVIILAGLVGDPITKKYPQQSEIINENGIRNCIDYFSGKGLNKLVFISTCSNYGLIGENELATEEFELKPLSSYASAKVTNEKYLLSKKNKVDYSGVILRFSTAFGLSPRMRFDLSVSEFVRDMFFQKELIVYDENTWRPYCHVRDFARLLEIVLNSDDEKVYFEVFNAGGEINNYTKKMLIDEIQKYLPNSKVKYSQNGSDPRNYRVSFKKVKNILDFSPEYSVKRGIKELIDSLELGLYRDSINNKANYGNYSINI